MAPGEHDLLLLAQGRHERPWTVLGAHPVPDGVDFAVWAPNAHEVSVVVDGVRTPMAKLSGGVWYRCVDGARAGQRYRYRILGADGERRDKTDPVGFRFDGADAVVYASRYEWRSTGPGGNGPMSVYEVHLGSWRPGLNYVDLAHRLADHVTGLGFTHVELLPVMEHPYGGSWGYQVTGYYAPTGRFGDPDEFRYLVDHLHAHGIGVILDWVPAHFPRDDWALADFDGTPLYEDADLGIHPDWGTLIFDYRRPEVRNFLIGSALYWCAEFRVDGLRVDAVASMLYLDYSRESGAWTPNEQGGNRNLAAVAFVRALTDTVRRRYPGVVLIAEESTSWPGVTGPTTSDDGLGFDLKWNLGWMHDTLAYLRQPPDRRRRARDRLTLPASYAFDERWLLPLSHDEVVHGKGALVAKLPGNRLERLAGLRGLLGYMWAFPGRKLLFMGSELAPDREWSEQHGLAWKPPYPGVGLLLTDLNRAYRTDPALWSLDATRSGFGWLVADDQGQEVVAFVRRGIDGSRLVCVSNFSDVDLVDHPVALPGGGRWREVINTEAVEYGGSGIGNLGAVEVRSSVANVQLAAHATVWFRPAGA